MVEIKARLQLWKQNTQSALQGRMGSIRSRSSSSSSQSSGQSFDGQSADSFTGQNRERSSSSESSKAPLPAHRQAELDRVARFQNKTRPVLTRLNAKYDSVFHQDHWETNHLLPAYVRSNALYKLGYTDSAKRSKEILGLLMQTGVVTGDKLMTRQNVNIDSLISLANAWPNHKPLSLKEQQGLSIYVEGMQQNMNEWGKKFLNVPAAQRPYALFFANFVTTPEVSRNVMDELKNHGVLDMHYNPVNGADRFDQYKQAAFAYNMRALRDPRASDRVYAGVHDLTENLRDALFPLPSYVAPRK